MYTRTGWILFVCRIRDYGHWLNWINMCLHLNLINIGNIFKLQTIIKLDLMINVIMHFKSSGWRRATDKMFDILALRFECIKSIRHSITMCLIVKGTPQLKHNIGGGSGCPLSIRYGWWVIEVCPIRCLLMEVYFFLVMYIILLLYYIEWQYIV